jgi:hypothetical protein
MSDKPMKAIAEREIAAMQAADGWWQLLTAFVRFKIVMWLAKG